MYRGPGRQYFDEVARRTGFRISGLEKAYRLVEILLRFQDDEILRDRLALKGGTALQFIYLGGRRLSVDADFNILGAERDKMLATRRELQRVLPLLFKALGYDFNDPANDYALLAYDLHYDTATGGRDLIKVEINTIERIPILGTVQKKFDHPFALGSFSLSTYPLEELAAGKTRAFLQRGGPKDLFDVAMLGTTLGPEIDSPARELAVLYCALGMVDLRTRSVQVEVDTQQVRNVLLPLLSGEFSDADTVVARANRFIRPLQKLTERERTFLEAFFDERRFDPESLLEDVPHRSDVAKHPVAKWVLRKRKA